MPREGHCVFLVMTRAPLLFTISILLATPLWGQWDTEDSSFVHELLASTYTGLEPGAVILIAQDGDILFHEAYGLASIELAVPMETDHVFAIGSIGKQFTAVAMLQLVAEGKLSLDDRVQDHLPDYDTKGQDITIRQLLNHSAGIPSLSERDTFMQLINTDMSREEILSLQSSEDLLFPPGENWSYSNSGFTLAAIIVEEVSGLSFPRSGA